LGINFIDTAASYGPGVNEEQIAQALYPYPAGLVIATKGGLVRGGSNDWGADGHPEYLKADAEGSLRRLKLDCIDVYQLHAVDPNVPLEESLGALIELRDQGKIRHIGLSNVRIDHIEAARRMVHIVSVQNRYSAVSRDDEDVVEYCRGNGIAFLPYFPL